MFAATMFAPLLEKFAFSPSTVIEAGVANPHWQTKFQADIANCANPRVIPLGPGELLATTLWGYHIVAPSWNLDVAPGIVRDGVIEPWTNEVVLSVLREGDTFVNVGANFGYYALLGAQRVGRPGAVYAIEANPYVFPYLVKSAFWSGFPDVIRMFNAVAAGPDQDGTKTEFVFDPQFIGGGGMASIANYAFRPITEAFWTGANIAETLNENRQFTTKALYCKVEAECRTIDSMVPASAKVDVMLIDAEGSECFVIAGAKETIRRNPQISLIVEWSPHVLEVESKRASAEAMWKFLLDEMRLQAFRICPDNYPGLGAMPRLESLSRRQLNHVPHSDIFLK
jgi:FkbM family methyltransferase